jgi:membrane-associated protease RseP (regulator of RpoE activity)
LALIVVGAGFAGYLFRGGTHPEPPVKESASSPTGDELLSKDPVAVAKKRESGTDDLDMEKRIRDLVGNFGGAIPATSLARGFHVPDLGMRIAFLTSEQSASTLGAMSAGAVVMEVESGRPMAKAGIHVGDVVLSIAGKKIASEDDLRQAIFKIGPGKTQYSYRRDGDIQTVAVDCSGCKVE